MRKFVSLCKVNLRSLLNAFRIGKSKTARGGYAAIILLLAISLYMSLIYSSVTAAALQQENLLDYMLPMMSVMSLMMSLMFTMFAAQNIVFGSKDTDLMLSLPVSAFEVMLARITALLIEELLLNAAMLLPAFALYALNGGRVGWGALLLLPVCVLLAVLASLLSLIIGFVTALLSSRFRHRSLVESIIYLLVFGGFTVVYVQVGNISSLVSQNPQAFVRLFHSWLLPAFWAGDAVHGNVLSLLLLAAVTVLPFLAVTLLCSLRFQKILSALQSRPMRRDYRLQKLQSRSVTFSLFFREVKRLFGTPMYFFNMSFGLLMMLGAGIFSLIKPDMAQQLVQTLHMPAALPLTAVCVLMSATVNTACVSISLEGRCFWIIKSAPISPQQVFNAKINLNALVSAAAAAVGGVMLGVALQAGVLGTVLGILCACACGYVTACIGLTVNLLLPKMDADNDIVVIKQSASALCGIFGGVLCNLIFGALSFAAAAAWGVTAGQALYLALCALAAGLLQLWLHKVGTRLYNEL